MKREKNKRERRRKGGRDRHEAFKKDELQQEIRAVEDHTSLNVTQAAGHEERWREQITHTKKNIQVCGVAL